MTEPEKLAPSSSPVEPEPVPDGAIAEIVTPLDLEKGKQAFEKFQAFKERLLGKEDYVTIGQKRFLKKSAWRKWALVCNISDRLESVERTPATGRDADGAFMYRIVVTAFHLPTGRSATGTAICSSSEKSKWAHVEHDVYSTCHTRAKNRAIADLVGGGEVSAEEVEQEGIAKEDKTA